MLVTQDGTHPVSENVYLYYSGDPYAPYRQGVSGSTGDPNFACDIDDDNTSSPTWPPITEGQYYLRIGSRYATLIIGHQQGSSGDFKILFDGSTFHLVWDQRGSTVLGSTYDWTITTYPVQINQVLADNQTTVGSVHRWSSGSFVDIQPIPFTFDYAGSRSHVLQGDQGVNSGQKYITWNDYTDVTNYRAFYINGPTSCVSFFNPTDGSVTITSQLADFPGTAGDSIDFMDPWFINYPDTAYGGFLRNQSMSAPFIRRKCPFSPDLTTFYDGNLKYNGVFLAESGPPQWNAPYYSVGGPRTRSIGGSTLNFLNWEGDPAYITFQNPDSLKTAVVFNLAGATATAVYKAHLASSSIMVTAPTTQRKLIRDNNGNYHMAYESGYGIWYVKSTNAGATWSPEQYVALSDGYYLNRSPSITVQQTPHKVIVVWEEYTSDNSYYEIDSRVIDPMIGSMDDIAPIYTSSTSSSGAMPVVATGNDGVNDYQLALWYETSAQVLKASVRQGSSGGWSGQTTILPRSISSFSLSPITYGPDHYWHLVWVQGAQLHYGPIQIGSSLTLGTTADSIISSPGADYVLANPSAADLYNSTFYGYPAVAWEEWSGESSPRVINYRERSRKGRWSTVQVFSGGLPSRPSYYSPTLAANYLSANLSIAWRSATNQLKYVQRKNGSWSSQTNLATGYDPMASAGLSNPGSEIILWRGSTSLYPIQQTTLSYGQLLAGAQIAEGRGGRITFPAGMMELAVQTASVNGSPLAFAALDDSVQVSTAQQFESVLRSDPFPGNSMLSLTFSFSARGTYSSGAKFDLAIEDAATARVLATLRSLRTQGDSIAAVSTALAFNGRSVVLALKPSGTASALAYEVEQWNIDSGGGAGGMGKSNAQVAEVPRLIPTQYDLHQNYPNPFNPSTRIDYDLPEPGIVALVIYDVLGRQVAQLANTYQDAGFYTISWNAHAESGVSVASGVYLAQLTVTDALGKVAYSKTNKLLLMK